MGARQSVALLAAALCLVAAVGTAAGGASAIGGSGTATADFDVAPAALADGSVQSQSQRVTPDTVVLDVTVYGNGTAKWEVVYRTRLDDSQTAAAFRSYKNDVEANSTKYSRQFVGRMNSTIRSAEQTTGREMSGTNYSVRAEIREFPQRYGLVVYSFKWHGFAAVSNGEVRIGDSLSGLILNEKTRLLVKWPEEYDATTVQPRPDSGYEKRENAVIWNGPIEFAGNEPRIVLTAPGGIGPNVPWTLVATGVGGLALVALLAAGGWWLYRDREQREPVPESEDPPEDLLSNEERVLRLLERRGGRIKQRAVVDELGWTEAKTSQVVGSLREQGKIESFRLGRENVLALPTEQQES
ncbi:hypothetical protein M0R88_01815 [Halorussus gelatinilyticus]|uniref:DUF4897 domain-containing protein n=1 Tax=Halorussus gelatinilyticus TaxID=2937524 RepID=A0A8U0IJM1_9EURY|nr:hypothetical protein [Halorussus gelatinilyticus]UPW00851.1 hypothetical protein M0R88_01815 [Halorussus gelatinilyticus]